LRGNDEEFLNHNIEERKEVNDF